MSEDKKLQPGQINIELTEEIADGIYSNLAVISHSNAEFIVDFIRVLPGVQKAKVKSRIVLTPIHAKKLLTALADNVQKFEAQHGKIVDNEPNNNMPMNFGTPTAQA
ncbi:MAG: hypothetical protein ACI8ZX_000948 [Planctomycetota bacterium]|jgi:hypothetical protein